MRLKLVPILIIIIAGLIFSGGCLSPSAPDETTRNTGIVTVNATGGNHYSLVSDEGIVYYPLNPEVIVFPQGTRVYWEGIPGGSPDYSRGIPIQIEMIAKYVPPYQTLKITLVPSDK